MCLSLCNQGLMILPRSLCTPTAASTSSSSVRKIVPQRVGSFVTLVSRLQHSDVITQRYLVVYQISNN